MNDASWLARLGFRHIVLLHFTDRCVMQRAFGFSETYRVTTFYRSWDTIYHRLRIVVLDMYVMLESLGTSFLHAF